LFRFHKSHYRNENIFVKENKMKKLLQIILILALCSVAYAAVSITISVPDAYVPQILAAMNELAGTHMTLEARGSNPDPSLEFDGRWDFRIAPKGDSETNGEFAKRFTTELLRASVRLVKLHEENQRYRDEISKIVPPNVQVPDEVIK